MKHYLKAAVFGLTALGLAALGTGAAAAAEKIVLHGASQFDESHAFTRLMRKFEQLVNIYYNGDAEIEFVMHPNSELGLEKDYFAYMSQGISVDYAVVAPSHMSTFSKMAPLMDMPMLFRDLAHWSKVLSTDTLQPIADDVAKRADVMLIGYGGGGVRNLIVNKPVKNMAEIEDLQIRVMGAPIQTRMFLYGPSKTLLRKVPEIVAIAAFGTSCVTSTNTSAPQSEFSSANTILSGEAASAEMMRSMLRFMTAPKFNGI